MPNKVLLNARIASRVGSSSSPVSWGGAVAVALVTVAPGGRRGAEGTRAVFGASTGCVSLTQPLAGNVIVGSRSRPSNGLSVRMTLVALIRLAATSAFESAKVLFSGREAA